MNTMDREARSTPVAAAALGEDAVAVRDVQVLQLRDPVRLGMRVAVEHAEAIHRVEHKVMEHARGHAALVLGGSLEKVLEA